MAILACCCLSISGEVLRDRTHVDLHPPVKSIVEEEVVCHADPVRFHGMALAIVVVPHIALGKRKHPGNDCYNRKSFSTIFIKQD